MNLLQKILAPLIRTEAQRHLLYGKRRRARTLFEMLCHWSDTPENQFNLALVNMNLRNYDRALELLEPIHNLLPDQVFAGVTYGQCLLLAKRFTEAEAVYARLLESNPDNNLLKLLLHLAQDPVGRDKFSVSLDIQYQATLLQEDKQFRPALELLQKAEGLSSEDAALHNNIGALKLKLKYPLPEIMASFSRAMQLSPDNDRYKRNYRKVWQKSQSSKS
jgi:tetratricopeptide (TPR) repeat protein